jgi:hypothetical protein
MNWVDGAETYAGTHGWGARGKFIGISRMLNDSDMENLSCHQYVASYRPRGIISGFLVVVPNTTYMVFLPPIAAKMGPQKILCRLSESLKQQGAIFSAYMYKLQTERKLVIEDIIVWNNKALWFNTPFNQRWSTLNSIFQNDFLQDIELQKCIISAQTYVSLSELKHPENNVVVEFTPFMKGVKRLIWMAPKGEKQNESNDTSFYIKKEQGAGPDVYILYKGESRIGQALVRTLAISKQLRTACQQNESVPVQAIYNKHFDKWDIQGVKN